MHSAADLWEEAGEPRENPHRRQGEPKLHVQLCTCPLTHQLFFFLVMPNIVFEHLSIVHCEWSSGWPSPRHLGDSSRTLECVTLWFKNVVCLRSVMLLARTQMQHNLQVHHSLYWNIVDSERDSCSYTGCWLVPAGLSRTRPVPGSCAGPSEKAWSGADGWSVWGGEKHGLFTCNLSEFPPGSAFRSSLRPFVFGTTCVALWTQYIHVFWIQEAIYAVFCHTCSDCSCF